MSSSDRSGGREPGRTAEGVAPRGVADTGPLVQSVRVRRVIRSSSHPPAAERPAADAPDVSGARPLPLAPARTIVDGDESTETRAKKVTPAERPRRRRKVQAAQAIELGREETRPVRHLGLERRPDADRVPQLVVLSAPDAGDAPPPSLERGGVPALREAQLWRVVVTAVIVLLVAAVVWALLLRR